MLKWSEGHVSIMWESCKDCGQTNVSLSPSLSLIAHGLCSLIT